ncbi:MAG: hypothetical protein QM758_09000 [Armatimonas sp.]
MRLTLWVTMALVVLSTSGALAQSKPQESEQSAPKKQTLFTVDVEAEPVRLVLKDLFATANIPYTLDSTVTGFLTLTIKDAPFETALKAVMRSAFPPLSYTKEADRYIVFPRPIPRRVGEEPLKPKTLDLDLREAPLRETIAKIMAEARVDYAVAPEISGKVTLQLRKVTWPVALTEILLASDSRLYWRWETGVYVIALRNPRSERRALIRE